MKLTFNNLFRWLAGLALLAVAAVAQDFSFSGDSSVYPFAFGTLPPSTNTFIVEHQTPPAPPDSNRPAYNGWQVSDGLSFTLPSNSIVTITGYSGLNLPGMGGLLIYELEGTNVGAQVTGVGGSEPAATLVLTTPLPAGSYELVVTTGTIGLDGAGLLDLPPIYEINYTGSVAVVSLPVVSIGNATVAEGGSGTTNITFSVSLSQPFPLSLSVNYATADDTAISGYNNVNYDYIYGTVTFAPGQTNQTIAVTVNGGTLAVPKADFFVNLNNAQVGGVSATMAKATGTGTILNEEYPPVFQSVTQTNGTIQFLWSTVPGQTCQLQSNPDLNSTNWINLGSSVTATNTTASASDSITNAQNFYRIMLVQ